MPRKEPLSRDELLDMMAKRLKRTETKDADWIKIAEMYRDMFCRERKGVKFKPEDEGEDVDAQVKRIEAGKT